MEVKTDKVNLVLSLIRLFWNFRLDVRIIYDDGSFTSLSCDDQCFVGDHQGKLVKVLE